MKRFSKIISFFVFTCLLSTFAHGQLAVTVSAPKITGQKALVPLMMKNGLEEKIQSARATVFLLYGDGKIAGQTAQWVIGGNASKSGLAAGATNVFNIVITGIKPFTTTNLTANVNFSRIILASGESADPKKTVTVQIAPMQNTN